MLRRTTIIANISLAIVIGVSLFFVMNPSSSPIRMQKLITSKEENRLPTHQVRNGVRKDLWISDDSGRLHHQIQCPRSVLTATPIGNHLELTEEMQDMKCYLQENLSPEAQQVRFIQSQTGTYHYNDQHFDAPQVFLALFHLPGKALDTELDDTSAYLKGIAEKVSLSFAENTPAFKAEKFKAHINTQNKLRENE